MDGTKLGAIFGAIEGSGNTGSLNLSFLQISTLFGHSILAGLILTLITFFISKKFQNEKGTDLKRLMGASNIMFLCVGLTGVMILINNSFIRAFAIVAAIALVRFRVKLSNNNLNSSLLFGVMTGMSFGVQEIQLGWMVVGVFLILLIILFGLLRVFRINLSDQDGN